MAEAAFDKRVTIFSGHYGSGKSEISVNTAFILRKKCMDVLLADMDIVNPFFRSIDAKRALESAGIRTIAPMYANTNVDVPAIGPEISAALHNESLRVILDVGGDEEGARVLGRFSKEIPEDDYDMFFVFNRSRPMTTNLSDTLVYIREIEVSSRLKFTGIINNTHFMDETTADDILYGAQLALEISHETGIPFFASSVMEELVPKLEPGIDHPLIILKRNIIMPFRKP